MSKTYYRTIWISDIHIGSYGCKSEILIKFLDSVKCDTLFLVGDIIDGWAISRNRGIFSQSHVNIIRKILSKAKSGTKIVYVIGNHDDFIKEIFKFFSEVAFGNIHFCEEESYTTLKGKRLLVIHGDQFDQITKVHRWLAILGDAGYTLLLKINNIFNGLTKLLGTPYWSLSSFVKKSVKKAVVYITDFEIFLSKECKKRGYDGVVCGHIHSPEIRKIDDITYYNCGDWVESCSALVENEDGTISLLIGENYEVINSD